MTYSSVLRSTSRRLVCQFGACDRLAGRHLPEFREISKDGYDFFTMCQIPELAVELSLQPLRRYGVDAVIIFSDILVVPQAMGMDVKMVPGEGPVFTKPLCVPSDIESLCLNPDIEQQLGYVLDALNLARQKIMGKAPLIGFCGGPLSLFMFMVEGKMSRNMTKLKMWLYQFPEDSHRILKAISNICVDFLVAQQQAGAQALQVFETVGVDTLSQEQFYTFVYPYLKDIAKRVKDECPNTPLIVFSKGTDYAFERLATTKFDVLGLDWTSDPEDVRRRVGTKALQGNLDPCIISTDTPTIERETIKMIESFGTKGYIANLGHGCSPTMDPKHVQAFVTSLQQKSSELNTIQYDENEL